MRVKWCSVTLSWCFLFRLFASQWWRTGCPRITGDASLQPHLKPFLWIISLSPSFDAIVETLKNEPVSTPCVFSCQVFSLIKTRVRVHLYTFRWGRVGPQLVLSLLASSKRSRSPKSSGKRATPVQNIHPSLFCTRKMEELKLISTETLRDLIYEKFERMPDYPKTAEEEDPLAKVRVNLKKSSFHLIGEKKTFCLFLWPGLSSARKYSRFDP